MIEGDVKRRLAAILAGARAYRDKLVPALAPVAARALGAKSTTVMDDLVDQYNARCTRLGLVL